tara:strand:- start:1250 stop:1525 length:276 start_codon:yes stop_codon:yes gene_type:complete
MRYKNTPVRKDKNGVRYYRPTIVPNIPITDGDQFIFPFDGDRLDSLAQRYYGDSNLWWIIAKANNINNGQIGLDPEKMIRIPGDISKIINR